MGCVGRGYSGLFIGNPPMLEAHDTSVVVDRTVGDISCGPELRGF